MAPVARELSKKRGVIEPLQTRDSQEGQIAELREQISVCAGMPVTLIGSSWGAVLALFTAARKEVEVEKLILIGSAVFDSENSSRIEGIRMSRLDDERRQRLRIIDSELGDPNNEKKAEIAKEWGDIFFHTDVYDPLTADLEVIEVQYELNVKVWSEYTVLRDKPDYLENEYSKIDIPTVVIHGDYDPHPLEGIRPLLESCIEDIRFYILPKCGHYPWIERHARDRFFEILESEIG
jgi:pimeloyl-ACP methyl ester carboxylesterase